MSVRDKRQWIPDRYKNWANKANAVRCIPLDDFRQPDEVSVQSMTNHSQINLLFLPSDFRTIYRKATRRKVKTEEDPAKSTCEIAEFEQNP